MNKTMKPICKLAMLALLNIPLGLQAQRHRPQSDFTTDTLMVHDPVMAKGEDGRYYLFMTGMNVGVISSADMKEWKSEPSALPETPAWAMEEVRGYRGHTWAPDISYHNGLWHLYYSCSTFGKNGSAIGLAVNKTLDRTSKDFKWEAGKGFVPQKAVLGEPIGNLANNDQYLINPIYEETIMQEAAKQSVMMNLVTHRPMNGPSIFIPERDRGGIELKWLTSYGQKIDATKSNMPTRTELKAYTLAGYVPFFDEFGEDVFVDLGKMFLEDFTEAYGQEFDRQCLIADDAPFTGAINMEHAEVHASSSASITDLTYEDFRAAELKVEPEERKFCKWFMNETVLNHITNIRDDNNNPIWRKPWEGMPGRLDGYDVIESRLLPQFADIEADTPFAIFMNPKRIIHGNRKGIEIKRFDETTESLEYGELFMRFRKRDGFLVTRPKKNMIILSTADA